MTVDPMMLPPWTQIIVNAIEEAVKGQIALAYRDGYRDGANIHAGGTKGYDPARAYEQANERADYYARTGETL